jgi:AraC-like DNA-binding protein
VIQPRAATDPVDGAHLTAASRPSPPIYRYPPTAGLADLIGRYWIPVWSVPQPSTQRTLQHPACLIVVSNTYARCYGVARGLSQVTLDGDGWAAGVMLRPAAGRLVFDRPGDELVDATFDLAELATLDGAALTATVHAAMSDVPHAEASHRAAIAAYEAALAPFMPVDSQGLLLNAVIDWLRDHAEVTRVAEVAGVFGLSERALQRLVTSRLGLSPKWLIQRRRLHDAVAELKAGTRNLADLAADLGYADQAHFTHDFRTVTGVTPGEYRADQPSEAEAGESGAAG